LSGGEKTRVALARMLADPGNLLLLDEPTNHLDTESADKLTESLLGYDGTILFISHNLDFARRLSNKVWNVADGQVEVYPGSLGDYLDYLAAEMNPDQEQDDSELAPKLSTKPASSKEDKKRVRAEERKLRAERGKKISKLQKRIAELETSIETLEAEQSEQEARLASPSDDYDEMAKLSKSYEKTKLVLEEKVTNWTEAQETLDALQD
jgi:ATP-binding cassette, subfamily F, member 3